MAQEDKKGSSGGKPPLGIMEDRLSYNGLNVLFGRIAEECNRDLVWPECMTTYKKMAMDATIAPALNLMEMSIAKAEWHVRVPEGYETQLSREIEFLESVMNDMDRPWNDFIRSAATFSRYGFAPHEKVYKVRRRGGSRYNDGLYGLHSMPLISQDSVSSWEWTEDGRELVGLKQKVNIPKGSDSVNATQVSDYIFIPREKFILFRADPQKDSPVGTSPLNSIYLAWRYKGELERHQSVSVANDLRGFKVLKIPPRYMSENASPEEKKTFEAFQKMLRSINSGDQSGAIIPNAYDENGKPMFDFEVVSVMGQAAHDLNDILIRLRKDIITGILNPQLILGQEGGGSYALAEALGGVTNTVIDARLKEIRDQLNHELVPQLFGLNGFSTEVMPYFDYVQTDNVTLDELSKFIQRVASVGLIKQDAKTVNWIAEQAGMPVPFEDKNMDIEEVREQLTGHTSRGGDGMASAGEGTSDSPFGADDSSIGNMENA